MIREDYEQTDGTRQDSLNIRLGEVAFSVCSDLPEVLTDLEALYRGFTIPVHAERMIRMSVIRKSTLFGSRYVIKGDGRVIGQARRRREVLPYLEWGVNARVINTRRDFLLLHAASMVYQGQGVLLPAVSGNGKSTLAAALLARGWNYLCDEFALIHPDTLCLHPFPKAICVKQGAFEVMRQLNLTVIAGDHYVKAYKGRVAYVRPTVSDPRSITTPAPIRYVVFPKYRQGTVPRLFALGRAQAACTLAAHALNRQVFKTELLVMLERITRQAKCRGLDAGEIESTCNLLESLVSQSSVPKQQPMRALPAASGC